MGVELHVVLDFTNTIAIATQHKIIPARDIPNTSPPIIPPVTQIELFSSPTDPPSSLLNEETTQKISQNSLCDESTNKE